MWRKTTEGSLAFEAILGFAFMASPFFCLWGMYYVYQHQATMQATWHMNWIVLECLLALLFIILILTMRSVFRWGKRKIKDKNGTEIVIDYGLPGCVIIPGLFIALLCYIMYFFYQDRATLHFNWLEGELAALILIAVNLVIIKLLSL